MKRQKRDPMKNRIIEIIQRLKILELPCLRCAHAPLIYDIHAEGKYSIKTCNGDWKDVRCRLPFKLWDSYNGLSLLHEMDLKPIMNCEKYSHSEEFLHYIRETPLLYVEPSKFRHNGFDKPNLCIECDKPVWQKGEKVVIYGNSFKRQFHPECYRAYMKRNFSENTESFLILL